MLARCGGGHSKEIDSMTGYAVEVGRRLKVPVGVNEGLMYLIKSMEGEVGSGWQRGRRLYC